MNASGGQQQSSGTSNGPAKPVSESFKDRKQQAWEQVLELDKRQRSLPDPARLHASPGSSRFVVDELERLANESRVAREEARSARRRYLLRFELPVWLHGLAILLAAAAINFLWFAALGGDYFGWFLASGFIVALLFGVVAIAIDLDQFPGLIAAYPLMFVRDIVLILARLSEGATQQLLNPGRTDPELAESGLGYVQSPFRSRWLDRGSRSPSRSSSERRRLVGPLSWLRFNSG